MTFDLDPSVTAALAVSGAAVAVLALLVAVVAVRQLRRLRRDLLLLQGDGEAESFVAAVAEQVTATERLRGEVGEIQDGLAAVRGDLADALRHVAVVRYDAFNDMGGRMSFSAALLDDSGDGLVVTSINGRTETRTYAKGVQGGASDSHLSPEEIQAIAFARRSNAPRSSHA